MSRANIEQGLRYDALNRSWANYKAEQRDLGVYPGCRNPAECRKRGYCPMDPSCGD